MDRRFDRYGPRSTRLGVMRELRIQIIDARLHRWNLFGFSFGIQRAPCLLRFDAPVFGVIGRALPVDRCACLNVGAIHHIGAFGSVNADFTFGEIVDFGCADVGVDAAFVSYVHNKACVSGPARQVNIFNLCVNRCGRTKLEQHLVNHVAAQIPQQSAAWADL